MAVPVGRISLPGCLKLVQRKGGRALVKGWVSPRGQGRCERFRLGPRESGQLCWGRRCLGAASLHERKWLSPHVPPAVGEGGAELWAVQVPEET